MRVFFTEISYLIECQWRTRIADENERTAFDFTKKHDQKFCVSFLSVENPMTKISLKRLN